MTSSLGIFLREPRAGRAKTRLIPALGPEDAASLYHAFVEDTLNLALRSSARHCRLWTDGRDPDAWVSSALAAPLRSARARGRVDVAAQCAGDLGARLGDAFARAGTDEEIPMLMIGTDGPDLPELHLENALVALREGADVVLGAAADGGVWCIGLARPIEGFFDDLPWSASTTGDALRARARGLGLVCHEAPAWFDCDTPDDLDALVDRLRNHPGRAKMTWEWLAQHERT